MLMAGAFLFFNIKNRNHRSASGNRPVQPWQKMTASEDKMQTCTVGENIKLADFVKGEEVER